MAVSASLTSLNLGYNGIGAEGAKALAAGVAVSASLTSLDVSWNLIDAEAAIGLVSIFKEIC